MSRARYEKSGKSNKQTSRELSIKIQACRNQIGKRKLLEIGWFPDAQYPSGESVANVARWQEFGTGAIPPRPFLRPTVAANRTKYVRWLKKGIAQAIEGNTTIEQTMDKIGLAGVGDVKKSIMQVWQPPLSPVTIERRRKRWYSADSGPHGEALEKPLVDTTRMINSVSYQVSVEE